MLNVAVFPFRTKDGTAPKPGSPQLTGSIQFTMEQLQELWQYAQQQAPDEYGKIRVPLSLWDTVSKDGSMRYLKGNAKAPVSPQQQAMHQQVAATQQQAYAAASQAAYGLPSQQPLPAWNNAQAYQQQQNAPLPSYGMPQQQPKMQQQNATEPVGTQSPPIAANQGLPPMTPPTESSMSTNAQAAPSAPQAAPLETGLNPDGSQALPDPNVPF